MPFLPPMTGHGLFVPPIKMVMTGGWFMKLYPHDSIQKKRRDNCGYKPVGTRKIITLVGGFKRLLFSIIYGMIKSFQLTNSYFSRWLYKTINQHNITIFYG